jgi:GWxTD domain-containing protein
MGSMRRLPTIVPAILAVAITTLTGTVSAAQKVHTAEDLFQPFLEGDLSQWLVGPIGRLATEDEITQYLRLKTADDAKTFIDAFWARRDPDPGKDGNPVRELYETRATEADKKFSEAAVSGRRTDRGTIHILYGAPESVDYEQFRDVSGPDVELWRYSKKAEAGLDGRRPEKEYRFAKLGDLTRFYGAREMNDQERKRRQNAEPGFPSSAPGGPGEPIPREPGVPGEP